MELQEWVDGKFTETDTDYKIAGRNILYKNEESYLIEGVKLLCDKLHPVSVLEFVFGLGWTASEFQRRGETRHVISEPNIENYQMALTCKESFMGTLSIPRPFTDIEILNIFSWDYNGGETFDLVYDDVLEFGNTRDRHREFVDKFNYDYVVFIQATNVFLKKNYIRKALNIFFKNNFDSLLSVIKSKKFIWEKNKSKFISLNYDYKKRQLRQNLNYYFIENGSFYIFSMKGFMQHKNRLFGKIGYSLMSKNNSLEIDYPEDIKTFKHYIYCKKKVLYQI